MYLYYFSQDQQEQVTSTPLVMEKPQLSQLSASDMYGNIYLF